MLQQRQVHKGRQGWTPGVGKRRDFGAFHRLVLSWLYGRRLRQNR
jgi:hypothetical protein